MKGCAPSLDREAKSNSEMACCKTSKMTIELATTICCCVVFFFVVVVVEFTQIRRTFIASSKRYKKEEIFSYAR